MAPVNEFAAKGAPSKTTSWPYWRGSSLNVSNCISGLHSYLRYRRAFEQLTLPEGTDGPKPVGGLTRGPDDSSA